MQEDRAIAASGTGALVSDQAPSGLAPTGFDPAIATRRGARFDQILIGHNGISPNGTEFRVCGIDEDDRTVMDEHGTWLFFDDCDFPEYVW